MFDDFRAENSAWLILLLPLLSAAGITLFTLRHGVRSAKISITAVVLTFVLSLGLFFLLKDGRGADTDTLSWLHIGDFKVDLGGIL